ncbi:DUF1932 domain-containing protein [Sphingomonas sp.]|uniref:NAD(P)-dependent oxidoreductase n=1 Tax=Sphingomonas sp. TaxID=28214 RepID=UPI0031CF12D6
MTFVGFGEAGSALAKPGDACWDRLFDDPAAAPLRRTAALDVEAFATAEAALRDAEAVVSVVTADQALPAARGYADLLRAGALWLDFNSVSPGTKRAAATAVERCGARYVDVAVMAPVLPAARDVPLLLSGPHAGAGLATLVDAGFGNVRVIDGPIGAAAAVKMVRSIMIKGIEALSAECILAAEAAGVREEVIASLDASRRDSGWETLFDYNLDRMMVHGRRRAAELDEVTTMLNELGLHDGLTRAAALRQRLVGELSIAPAEGLVAKLAQLTPVTKEMAA